MSIWFIFQRRVVYSSSGLVSVCGSIGVIDDTFGKCRAPVILDLVALGFGAKAPLLLLYLYSWIVLRVAVCGIQFTARAAELHFFCCSVRSCDIFKISRVKVEVVSMIFFLFIFRLISFFFLPKQRHHAEWYQQ